MTASKARSSVIQEGQAALHRARSALYLLSTTRQTTANTPSLARFFTEIGETYATELRPFGARVLIVALESFRTKGVHGAPPVIATHIHAYDAVRRAELALSAD